MLVLIIGVLFLTLYSGEKLTEPGTSCEAGKCCNVNLNGYMVDMCPVDADDVVVHNHPLPSIVNQYQPTVQTYQYRSLLPRNSEHFDIKVMSMNVLGFKWPHPWSSNGLRASEEKDARISATADYLRKSDIDVVFLQELWMFSDFQKLRSIYPYSSYYGTPNSRFCPQVRNHQGLYFQASFLDCNGVTILSKHPILNTITVPFIKRIDTLNERFVARGFTAATILISKMVGGINRQVKVTAIDPHMATWYGPENLHTAVREAHADQILQFARNAGSRDNSDVVIIAGDLNSSPNTPVYNKFSEYTDALLDSLSDSSVASIEEFATWGRPGNTWSGPSSEDYDGHTVRIDYVLYYLRRKNNVKSIKTLDYSTVDLKTTGVRGEEVSLSDHAWVKAEIRMNF